MQVADPIRNLQHDKALRTALQPLLSEYYNQTQLVWLRHWGHRARHYISVAVARSL